MKKKTKIFWLQCLFIICMFIVCGCSKTDEKDKKTKESDVSADGQNIEENKEDSIDTDTTETFMKEETVQKWASYYLEVIELINGYQYKYDFAYINDDEIPELIVRYPYLNEYGYKGDDFEDYWKYSFYSYNPKDGKIYSVDIDKATSIRTLFKYNERTGNVWVDIYSDPDTGYSVSTYIYELVFDKPWETGKDNFVMQCSHYAFGKDDGWFWDSDSVPCSFAEYEGKLYEFHNSEAKSFKLFENSETITILEFFQNEYSDDLPDWKKAYMFYIFMNGHTRLKEINFINIDEDDIPEIFFDKGSDRKLLCYSEKQLYCHELSSYEDGLLYLEGQNLFYDFDEVKGDFFDILYSLKNGNLIENHRGWYGCYDTPVLDDNGEIIYSYEWNGEEVSKEGYEKLLEKYFDKDAASRATGKYNLIEALSILGSDEEIKTDSDSYSKTEFDAAGYVEACLDLLTKGETEKYMEMTKRTQIQAEDDYEKNLNAMVESMGVTGISAQLQEDYKMFFGELYKKSKYTVKNAEKMKEKDGYIVTVEINQITGLFNGLNEELAKKTQMLAQTYDVYSMTYDEQTELVFSVMLDLMNKRLNKITYAASKDITIEVEGVAYEADRNKIYSITDKSYEKINDALVSVEGVE